MKEYTYVLILFCSVIICFIASFDRRIRFDRYFWAYIKSSVLVAIPFIAWDIWFNAKAIWWFNTDYTLGINIAGIPLEECLFFICIPFCCIFTYFVIDRYYKLPWLEGFNNLIVFTIVVVSSVIALLHYEKAYTFLTAIVLVLTLVYLHFIAHADWIGKASLTFLILMFGFFPVNGILTGSYLESPVVNYNPDEFLGIRMGTIPIEDVAYGFAQFLLVLYFFNRFRFATDKKYNLNTSTGSIECK